MEDYVVNILVIAVSATVLFIIFAIVLAYKTRVSTDEAFRIMDLNAPLLPNSTAHRLDAALREASEGYNECAFCGFANFKRFPFCSVCGERLAAASDSPSAKRDVPSKRSALAAAAEMSKRRALWVSRMRAKYLTQTDAAGVASATNELRHRRARRRKEWTRRLRNDTDDTDEVNDNVKLYWHRDTSVCGIANTAAACPGLVLAFRNEPTSPGHSQQLFQTTTADKPDDRDGRRSAANSREAHADDDTCIAIVVESSESLIEDSNAVAGSETSRDSDTTEHDDELDEVSEELEALVAPVQIELLLASDADPSHLALASACDAALSWTNVLALAGRVFTDKFAHFVTATAALLTSATSGLIKIRIDRANLLSDSVESLGVIPTKYIRAPVRIHFIDEAGVDAGGLQREWFVLLSEQLADAATGVFTCTNKCEQTFYLNAQSRDAIGVNHLSYFYATGRLVGRALLEGQSLSFHLALPLLKIMLGIPVTFSDLEFYDPEAYKSMQWLLQHDSVDALGLDFTVTEQLRSGDVVTIELVPGGRHIDVTDANKHEYLDRKMRYLLFESVSSQLYVFLKGLYEVIPQELLMLFDAEEFDYLLCGSDEIDVDDWEKHTKYTADLHAHQAMIWFWEIVREMPNEYRRRLLQFATGSSRVPLSGFAGLTSYDGRLCPFTLKGVPLKDDGYIWSHACFNRLDLPLHAVRRELKAVMYASVETEMYGFTTD